MKKIKLCLFLLIALTTLNVANAQDTPDKQVKPEITNSEKSAIKSSEKKVKKTKFNGINYYVIDGLWHTKLKNKYVLGQAPKGAKIDFLPERGTSVIMDGVRYYKCKGVFYKKNKNDDLYEVAKPGNANN